MEGIEVDALSSTQLAAVQKALGLDDTATDANHFWSALQIMANLSTTVTKLIDNKFTMTAGAKTYWLLCSYSIGEVVRLKGSIGYNGTSSSAHFDIYAGQIIQGEIYVRDTSFGISLYKSSDGKTFYLYAFGYNWAICNYSISKEFTPTSTTTPTGTEVVTYNSTNSPLIPAAISSILSTQFNSVKIKKVTVDTPTAINTLLTYEPSDIGISSTSKDIYIVDAKFKNTGNNLYYGCGGNSPTNYCYFGGGVIRLYTTNSAYINSTCDILVAYF